MRRYTLSEAEWASLRASAAHRAGPQRRAARRDGLARTLVGSHRGVVSALTDGHISPFSAKARKGVGLGRAARKALGWVGVSDVSRRSRARCTQLGGRCELLYPLTPRGSGGGSQQPSSTSALGVAVGSGGGGGGGGVAAAAPRFYTERECARLQGFPDR